MFTAYKDAHVVVTGGANGIGKALGGSVAQLRRHSHFTGGLLKLLEQLILVVLQALVLLLKLQQLALE